MNISSALSALSLAALLFAGPTFAADHLSGQVLGGGNPIANSTVVLWSAGSEAPVKLAEAKTNNQGHFDIVAKGARSADSILYLVATGGVPKSQTGDNPAITLLAVLGNKPPAKVVINEFSTIASVWTTRIPRRLETARATLWVCASPPAMCRTLSTCKPAAGVARFRTHSTADRLHNG